MGQFRYPQTGGEKKFDYGDIPDDHPIGIGALLQGSLSVIKIPVQLFNDFRIDCPGYPFPLFDFDSDLIEWIEVDLVFKLQVIEKGFQGGELSFQGLGFEFGRDVLKIVFQDIFIDFTDLVNDTG